MGRSVNTSHHIRRRRGISLIEVIACTALVAIMIVPIAGVVRASAQSIAQANGSASTEARLRSSLRWVAQTIRESDIVTVGSTRLIVQLPDTSVGTFEVRSGDLVLTSGGNQTVLIESVRDIRFASLNHGSPPLTRAGLAISLRAQDASGNGWVTVNAIIAEPPQI